MTSSPVTTRPVPTGLSAGVVPPLRVWSARQNHMLSPTTLSAWISTMFLAATGSDAEPSGPPTRTNTSCRKPGADPDLDTTQTQK